MDHHSLPPPSYRESETIQASHNESTQHRIARKPIQNSRPQTAHARPSKAQWAEGPGMRMMDDLDIMESKPKMPPRPTLSVITGPGTKPADSKRGVSSTSTTTLTPSSLAPSLPPASASSTSSKTQKAFEDARHFAGGLISHPFESTRHYSILRHSHGLVFYQGPNTTLAISIFSDEPLPADRSIWLQSKGWTGKTGMKLKAFMGSTSAWLDVTPNLSVGVDQLKPTDERAWQRDIAKFRKKAVNHRRQRHILRETVIVRIPAEAEDGYFSLVLCTGGKKVLCPSPSFRILSTSATPHSLRGASLLTMPLEVGAMVLGTYATKMVAGAVAPVTSVVATRVAKYMPSWWEHELASKAYSGASNRLIPQLEDANTRFDQIRDASYGIIGGEVLAYEEGPKAPYPLHFLAPNEAEGGSTEPFNMPSLRLTNVSDRITQKLHGYYFGWARFVSDEKKGIAVHGDDWSQAVISVLSPDASQLARASIIEANRRTIALQHIEYVDVMSAAVSSHLEVKVLGFIRPDEPEQRAKLKMGLQIGDEAAHEAAMSTNMGDISVAQAILDHPSWGPEPVLQDKDRNARQGTLERVKSSYADARMFGERQIDRVPFAKMGIRGPNDRLKDKEIVMNGFWIPR